MVSERTIIKAGRMKNCEWVVFQAKTASLFIYYGKVLCLNWSQASKAELGLPTSDAAEMLAKQQAKTLAC